MVVVVIVLGVILTLDREEPNIYVQTEVNQKIFIGIYKLQ